MMEAMKMPLKLNRCRGCLRLCRAGAVACGACSKECNVCHLRFLRAELHPATCAACKRVMQLLKAVHKDMHIRADPERERRVVLYAERHANNQDIWTGKPRGNTAVMHGTEETNR